MKQTLLARYNELNGMKREIETHMAIYWPFTNKTAIKLKLVTNEMAWIEEALKAMK
ncbi:hypothetical protein Q5O24_11965 [Eubacteriaceae bacterium ES3]|nr:hypothetical protein Q5O24_11965 [Eubacteriaceae bacterium ES3]